jgi:hypothetical protein
MPNVPPFVFFVIVMVVIWLLSAVANAASKQKDAQNRQQARDRIQPSRTATPRAYRPPPPPLQSAQQPQRQLNAGYAVRHPEMMSPRSSPTPPRARVAVPQQRQQRQQRQQVRPQPRQIRPPRATPAFMPPPPIPVLEADDALPARRAGAAPPQQSSPAGVKPQAAQTATAPAISRWLKPSTLRQQFILTEIFQPPLAMRQERFG